MMMIYPMVKHQLNKNKHWDAQPPVLNSHHWDSFNMFHTAPNPEYLDMWEKGLPNTAGGSPVKSLRLGFRIF